MAEARDYPGWLFLALVYPLGFVLGLAGLVRYGVGERVRGDDAGILADDRLPAGAV